jgi:NAD(P)H dehydrogenase (quinone)
MIAVTGATGQLGRLVIASLLERVPAATVVAAVRNPDAAADLAAHGVEVRLADYDTPDTLAGAFAGAAKVLLISSNALGQRVRQHKAAIDAAQGAGVDLLVYTSMLRANASPLDLASDHDETERMIRQSGLRAVVLRNGWYTENYTTRLPTILERNTLVGCAGDGRISFAARRDYADAAAVVLASRDNQAGRVYEFAGDHPYTLTDFANEIGRQTRRAIAYRNLPEAEFAKTLMRAGHAEELATTLAQSETGVSRGGLHDDSRGLSALLGRATTPVRETIATALEHLTNEGAVPGAHRR